LSSFISSSAQGVGKCGHAAHFSHSASYPYSFDSPFEWAVYPLGGNPLLPLGDGSVTITVDCFVRSECDKCCDGTEYVASTTSTCLTTYEINDRFFNIYDIFNTGIPWLQGEDDGGTSYAIVGSWSKQSTVISTYAPPCK